MTTNNFLTLKICTVFHFVNKNVDLPYFLFVSTTWGEIRLSEANDGVFSEKINILGGILMY